MAIYSAAHLEQLVSTSAHVLLIMSRDSCVSIGQESPFSWTLLLNLLFSICLLSVGEALCDMQDSWPLHPVFRNLIAGADFVGAGGRQVRWGSDQERYRASDVISIPPQTRPRRASFRQARGFGPRSRSRRRADKQPAGKGSCRQSGVRHGWRQSSNREGQRQTADGIRASDGNLTYFGGELKLRFESPETPTNRNSPLPGI